MAGRVLGPYPAKRRNVKGERFNNRRLDRPLSMAAFLRGIDFMAKLA